MELLIHNTSKTVQLTFSACLGGILLSRCGRCSPSPCPRGFRSCVIGFGSLGAKKNYIGGSVARYYATQAGGRPEFVTPTGCPRGRSAVAYISTTARM